MKIYFCIFNSRLNHIPIKHRKADRHYDIVWFTMERTILSTRRNRGIREKNKTQRGSDITSRRTRECKKCSGITSNFHWSRLNGYRTCGGRFHTVIGFDRYCRYAIYSHRKRRHRRFSFALPWKDSHTVHFSLAFTSRRSRFRFSSSLHIP